MLEPHHRQQNPVPPRISDRVRVSVASFFTLTVVDLRGFVFVVLSCMSWFSLVKEGVHFCLHLDISWTAKLNKITSFKLCNHKSLPQSGASTPLLTPQYTKT